MGMRMAKTWSNLDDDGACPVPHLLRAVYPVKIKNGQLRLIINLSRLPISIHTHLLNFWFTGSQQRSARKGKR